MFYGTTTSRDFRGADFSDDGQKDKLFTITFIVIKIPCYKKISRFNFIDSRELTVLLLQKGPLCSVRPDREQSPVT